MSHREEAKDDRPTSTYKIERFLPIAWQKLLLSVPSNERMTKRGTIILLSGFVAPSTISLRRIKVYNDERRMQEALPVILCLRLLGTGAYWQGDWCTYLARTYHGIIKCRSLKWYEDRHASSTRRYEVLLQRQEFYDAIAPTVHDMMDAYSLYANV